jgi:hypothetical protein
MGNEWQCHAAKNYKKYSLSIFTATCNITHFSLFVSMDLLLKNNSKRFAVVAQQCYKLVPSLKVK